MALGVLFEMHHQAVFRTAYGVTRRHDEADDITQDVFIELSSAIKRFDLKRPFFPWLHRIAVRRSLDRIRRRKHRDVPIEEMFDLPSETPGPDLEAERSLLEAAVWNALAALDAKHRAAVVLRYYHGLSEAEMAVSLNCRRGVVKSRLHYARRRLGDLLPSTDRGLADLDPSLAANDQVPPNPKDSRIRNEKFTEPVENAPWPAYC
jgi:RNA polymerase sigma-70 factor (ECF subfamily)